MERKYLAIDVDFSSLVTNHVFPGKETSEFYDTIRSEFTNFAKTFALKFSDEYPALKETLLTSFKQLYPSKANDYTAKNTEDVSALAQVVIMIYERLIRQNLADSIMNFYQQHHTIPSVGQVFTLYDYEAGIENMLKKFYRAEGYSDNSMSWILQEYNFMLIMLNYVDPDNEDPADKSGVLKFYFSLHHAY